jgi:AbrB family looped-hinge helix DNA binding protein
VPGFALAIFVSLIKLNSVDKAGRIILPKPVRDRLQLREGCELALEEHPDGLVLRPIEHKSSMVQENGIGFTRARHLADSIGTPEERIKDVSGP